MFRRALTVFAIAAGLGSALVSPALAEGTPAVLDFVAEPGASPVSGKSGHWVDGDKGEVRAWEYQDVVKFDAETNNGFDYLRLEFSDSNGPIQVGAYDYTTGAHILAISGSLGCSIDYDYSSFTVNRIERDATGLTALDATFEHHCFGLDRPAMRGSVHFER